MFSRDDFVGPVSLRPTPLAGDLQAGLAGFGAAIDEEHAVQRRVINQALRDLKLRRRVEQVGNVRQRPHLVRHRVAQFRIAMSQRGHGNAGGEVQVRIAFVVPQARPLAAHQRHRESAKRLVVVARF